MALRRAFPTVDLAEDDPYLTGKAVATSAAQQVSGGTEAVVASSRAALTELFSATKTQSLLVVPMHCPGGTEIPRHGRVMGVIYMMRRSPGGYAGAEVTLLQDIGDRAGLVLAMASLHTVIEAERQRFRSAVDSMMDGLTIFSAVRDTSGTVVDFRFEFANEASAQMRGVPSDHVTGRRLYEAMPERPSQEHHDRWVRVIETGRPERLERDLVRNLWRGPDGPQRVYEAQAAKLGDGLVLTYRDVTEKAVADEALAVSEQRFRSAFDHSQAGLAVASLEPGDRGHLLRVNPALCDLTGFDARRLSGKRLSDLFDTDYGEVGSPGNDVLVNTLLGNNERRLCRCLRGDGQVTWAEVSVSRRGAAVVRKLSRLREAGLRLAIDDFGTGYCSLTYLARFPVDTVKIDRSFVAGLGTDTHATAIVEAVVALARTLGPSRTRPTS